MACLHLTDESEYPSNSSYLSTEFSSVKSINRNNNIINKKLYSAFSYVNPQQAISLKNFEDSNSDKISNFKSSFTFALSNSTSNSTSTSSFTSSGMSNLNKYAGKISFFLVKYNEFFLSLSIDYDCLINIFVSTQKYSKKTT